MYGALVGLINRYDELTDASTVDGSNHVWMNSSGEIDRAREAIDYRVERIG